MLFLPFSFPIHMACRRSRDYHVTCLWVWFTLYCGFKRVCEVLESYWSARVLYIIVISLHDPFLNTPEYLCPKDLQPCKAERHG